MMENLLRHSGPILSPSLISLFLNFLQRKLLTFQNYFINQKFTLKYFILREFALYLWIETMV